MAEAEAGNKEKEIIVVGSGFGGSVTASRLVNAGYRVTLLERGPWRDTLPVREAGIEDRKPLPRTGGPLTTLRSLQPPVGPRRGLTLNKTGFLEMWIGDGIKALCTSGVGGGSHIWAAMMVPPPAGFWDDRADGVSDEVMAPHYERVSTELRATYPPDSSRLPNHTDHAWNGKDYLAPLGPGEQPPMGIFYPDESEGLGPQTDDNDVVRKPIDYKEPNGAFGSPGGSKSTVDALYLLPAIKKGLIVKDMHEVRSLARTEEGSYTLGIRNLRNGQDIELRSSCVILAAGTMNTNRLMLDAREAGKLGALPKLGTGFGANGDLIGSWPAPDEPGIDTGIGPPIHGRVKITGHEEDGFFILAAKEPPPLRGFMLEKARQKASRMFELVAMSQDASDGRMWIENGRMKFCFDMKGSPSYAASMAAFNTLGERSGRSVKYDDKSALTAHAMGGCRLSADDSQGVVSGRGEVHGHPGLYIADASVFPQPTGVPPTLSIAAWASHVAAGIAADRESNND